MSGLTFSCPVCGTDVPRKAKSCPECGACEMSGWSEDQFLDGIDLPDEDYTTGRLLEDGADRQRGPDRGLFMRRLWAVVALLVLLAMVWLTLRGAR